MVKRKKTITKSNKQKAEEKLNKQIEKQKLQRAERRHLQRGEKTGWVIAFTDSTDLIYFYGTEIQCEEERRKVAYARKTKGIKRLSLPIEDELKKPIRGVNKMESKFTYRKPPMDWKEAMMDFYPGTPKEHFQSAEKEGQRQMEIRERIRKTHLTKRDTGIMDAKENVKIKYSEAIKEAKNSKNKQVSTDKVSVLTKPKIKPRKLAKK